MFDNKAKILTVTVNAWRDNTGINTLINFFKFWNPESVAQIYTRSLLPCTKVCSNFFRISETSVIKSIFRRSIKTGSVVENRFDSNMQKDEEVLQEQKLYSHKHSSIFSYLREFVWFFGKWNSKELLKFIDDFSPDVLFLPIYSTIYMGRIQKFIMKYTDKPVVSYISDDNYSYKSVSKNPFAIIHRFFLRKYVKYIIKNSDKLLVISPKQQEEYKRLFGIESKVLTKGIDFSNKPFIEKQISEPVKMVYTGKLIIGRWKSLSAIADALGEINKDKLRMTLDIYTTDSLTAKQSKLLNRNGCAVRGALSQEEVEIVQKNADILVFVESLEKRYKNTARLSFSTKLTDYLSSGKCIFAIGAEDIAPIDYLTRNDCAVIASEYEEIYNKMSAIVKNYDLIYDYSNKAYQIALKNHNQEKTKDTFIGSINSVL